MPHASPAWPHSHHWRSFVNIRIPKLHSWRIRWRRQIHKAPSALAQTGLGTRGLVTPLDFRSHGILHWKTWWTTPSPWVATGFIFNLECQSANDKQWLCGGSAETDSKQQPGVIRQSPKSKSLLGRGRRETTAPIQALHYTILFAPKTHIFCDRNGNPGFLIPG